MRATAESVVLLAECAAGSGWEVTPRHLQRKTGAGLQKNRFNSRPGDHLSLSETVTACGWMTSRIGAWWVGTTYPQVISGVKVTCLKAAERRTI